MPCVYRWHLNRRILAREHCKSGIFPHCAVYRQRGASVAYTSAMAHLTARYREPIAEKGPHIPPFSAPFPFEKTPFLCRLSAIPADHPRGNDTGSTMFHRHETAPSDISSMRSSFPSHRFASPAYDSLQQKVHSASRRSVKLYGPYV